MAKYVAKGCGIWVSAWFGQVLSMYSLVVRRRGMTAGDDGGASCRQEVEHGLAQDAQFRRLGDPREEHEEALVRRFDDEEGGELGDVFVVGHGQVALV
jgi:hypothetical protein